MQITPKLIAIIVICLLPVVAFGVWIYMESTKPLPGQLFKDLGREHISIGSEPIYNSNPPTSGNHYPDWTRAGVYDSPKDDRNLLHSLEHGYIIMAYNCDYPNSTLPKQELQPGQEATYSAQIATDSASLAPSFNSDQCKGLVENLKKIYDEKGKTKLIVVPRPSLDALVAAAAWTRLEKMNEFDKAKIEYFIDVLRDHGPEKTME